VARFREIPALLPDVVAVLHRGTRRYRWESARSSRGTPRSRVKARLAQ
jgi:hypothetical protein